MLILIVVHVTEERRRSQNNNSFGDSNQLFLGNLPHSVKEEDLHDIFSEFGLIIDLRIHNKSNKGPVNTRAPPHYGFITYENQQAVTNCLAAKVCMPRNKYLMTEKYLYFFSLKNINRDKMVGSYLEIFLYKKTIFCNISRYEMHKATYHDHMTLGISCRVSLF